MQYARLDEVIAALQRGDVDTALDAGLMELASGDDFDRADVSAEDRECILAATTKLHSAWNARERYRARQQRLDERARKRDARRAHASPGNDTVKPGLPAAAANALAKALARAKGQ